MVAGDGEIHIDVYFQHGPVVGILVLHAHDMLVVEAIVLVETAVPVP